MWLRSELARDPQQRPATGNWLRAARWCEPATSRRTTRSRRTSSIGSCSGWRRCSTWRSRIVAFEAEDTDGDVGETSFVAPEPPAPDEYDGKNALGVRLLDYEKRMDRTGDKIIYATYYGTMEPETE